MKRRSEELPKAEHKRGFYRIEEAIRVFQCHICVFVQKAEA